MKICALITNNEHQHVKFLLFVHLFIAYVKKNFLFFIHQRLFIIHDKYFFFFTYVLVFSKIEEKLILNHKRKWWWFHLLINDATNQFTTTERIKKSVFSFLFLLSIICWRMWRHKKWKLKLGSRFILSFPKSIMELFFDLIQPIYAILLNDINQNHKKHHRFPIFYIDFISNSLLKMNWHI